MFGIAAIKAKDVMHRDLKLPNVMLHFEEMSFVAPDQKELNEFVKQFDFENQY